VPIDEELLAATQCEDCSHARSLHRPGCVVEGCRCEWYANREGGVVDRLADQARMAFECAKRHDPRDQGPSSYAEELIIGAVYHVGAELARLLEERLPARPADPPALPPCASCGHAYAQHGQGCCFGSAHLGLPWFCRCTCYVMSVMLSGTVPAGGSGDGT
jgi:hypothetical protein